MLTGTSQGLHTALEGWGSYGSCGSAKCSNRRACSGRAQFQIAVQGSAGAGERSVQGRRPVRKESLNPQIVSVFWRRSAAAHAARRVAPRSELPTSTPRLSARCGQAAVANAADVSRSPDILKPAPIGHFVRFLRRADLLSYGCFAHCAEGRNEACRAAHGAAPARLVGCRSWWVSDSGWVCSATVFERRASRRWMRRPVRSRGPPQRGWFGAKAGGWRARVGFVQRRFFAGCDGGAGPGGPARTGGVRPTGVG